MSPIQQISRNLGYTCNWLQKVINKNGIKKRAIKMEVHKKCIVDNVEKN